MTASINVQAAPTPVLWLGTAAAVIPANALKDEPGNPILDENGNFILTE